MLIQGGDIARVLEQREGPWIDAIDGIRNGNFVKDGSKVNENVDARQNDDGNEGEDETQPSSGVDRVIWGWIGIIASIYLI